MYSLDKSSVYTEQELVNIINSLFQEEDTSYEDEVSAWCMILKYKDLLQYSSNEDITFNIVGGILGLIPTKVPNWISKMAKTLAEKGFIAFGNALDSAEEHGRTLISKLAAAYKNKSLSEEYINERFKKINEYQEIAKNMPECNVVAAVPYDKQMMRFKGLENIVDAVVSMADSHDEDSFASDNLWENLAAQSNTTCKVDPPKPGQNFKQFRWEPPFIKSFDFKKSEWNNSSSVEELKKKILEVKSKAFKDLLEAAKHLQTLCKKMQSEVEHKRFTDEETMARNYARNYVISKLIISIQNLILKEIGYFCTVSIKKLGKFKEQPKKEEPTEQSQQSTDDGNKKESSQELLNTFDNELVVSYESLLGDVKRLAVGMGIYKLFHVSSDTAYTKEFVPKKYIEPGPPRICFSPSLKGCIFSASGLSSYKRMSIYVIDPSSISETELKKHIIKAPTNTVRDASISREVWVTCKVRGLLLMTITIDHKHSKRLYVEDTNPYSDEPKLNFRQDVKSRNPVWSRLWAHVKIDQINKAVAIKVLGIAGYNTLKQVYDKQQKEQ